MDAIKYIEIGIKDAIRNYFETDDFHKELGIKNFQIIDIWERSDDLPDSYHRFHVLVKHKSLEDLDNCTAFQIFFYGTDLTLGDPMFDGRAYLKGNHFLWHNICYGSFTTEMADVWIKSVEEKIKGVA